MSPTLYILYFNSKAAARTKWLSALTEIKKATSLHFKNDTFIFFFFFFFKISKRTKKQFNSHRLAAYVFA